MRREKRGLSQVGLAERVGLTQQAISRIENASGDARPRVTHLYLICDALDMSPYDLIAESGAQIDRDELDALIVARVEFLVGTSRSELFGQCLRRLAYAAERRRRGFVHEAQIEAHEVIDVLDRELRQHPENVEIAATLAHAFDLAATTAMELHGPAVIDQVESIVSRMLDLATGSPFQHQDTLALALFRRADVQYVAHGGNVSGARDAINRCVELSSGSSRYLQALRVQAGIARKMGDRTGFLECVAEIDRRMDAGQFDALTVAQTHQGLATNCATIDGTSSKASWNRLEASESAYAQFRQYGSEDRHVESMILRSKAILSAIPGPCIDLDLAKTAAESGLAITESAGWRRTAGHCHLVLRAVRERRPLVGVPQ